MKTGIASLALICVTLIASPAATVGYRGDSAGRFPDATMPLAWDLEAGTGLRWRTAMPDKDLPRLCHSRGGLIVVGERVFTMAEPDTLLCLNAGDGKELWRVTVDRFSFFGDSGPQLRKTFLSVSGYDAKKYGPYGLKGSPQYQAWLRAAKAAKINPRKLSPRSPVSNAWQYTCSTPCSDGSLVYVMVATGVIAAYDLDGTKRWCRVHDLAQGTRANMILSDGRLYIGGADRSYRAKGGSWKTKPGGMAALDAASGTELWRHAKVYNGGGGWGSPMAVTLAGRRVVLSGGGCLIDPSTGAILATTAGAGQHSSLAVSGDVVVANSGNHYSRGKAFIRAFRITAEGEGLSATQIWQQPELGGNCVPIVVFKDRVVVRNNKGILRSFALADGRALGGLKVRGKLGAHCPLPSMLVVGDTLVTCDSMGQVQCLKADGESMTMVFETLLPGEVAGETTKRKSAFLYAAPFVSDGKAYFRTDRYVYQVGTPE